MMRYHVGPRAQLDAIRDALDREFGLRAADGTPTPRRARIVRRGVDVTDSAFDPASLGVVLETTTVLAPVTLEAPGLAALEIPDHPLIDPHLGRVVRGVAIPARAALLREDELPPPLRDQLPTRVGR